MPVKRLKVKRKRRLSDEQIVGSLSMLSVLVFGFDWPAALELGGDGEALLRDYPELVHRAWSERREEAWAWARDRKIEPWALRFDNENEG